MSGRTVAASGVLDLFSAAAGGWSLGMHRAGFKTIAACEAVEWRRVLYAQNNPGVPIYDDVVTLTAARLLRDVGQLPAVIVGSPPCQDISSANTKGKGVEGERSILFFEAIRLIGECRPRWFALENSSNLRTRGADAVLAALEDIDYACWPLVVRASDIGANHERPRSWIIGCDLAQVTAHAHSNGKYAQPEHGEVAEYQKLRDILAAALAKDKVAEKPLRLQALHPILTERTKRMDKLSEQLEALAARATAGEWGVDAVNSEGEYGSGPNTHSGFHVSEILGPDGKVLFDAINSDACLVNEEFDDEGYCYAWDETSGHNAALIVTLHNNLPTIIAALRSAGQ